LRSARIGGEAMLCFSSRTTLRRFAFTAFFLLSAAAAADERWSTYGNARFGVFADYPSSLFTVADAPPENGDGQRFHTADGSAELAVYGSYNIDNDTPEDYVANRVDLADVSYKKIGRDFYVISGTRDASIFYRRCNFPNRDVIACFNISYPEAEKATWDQIVSRIARSLRLGEKGQAAGQ
jgi:hypothetical protein